eukprot:INCI5653.1.p2 GENE.INCI5653.1~~INCI5653.1.p2  ORF type:complete len:117 (+),score=25.66 INCI5653.1:243-593(+)
MGGGYAKIAEPGGRTQEDPTQKDELSSYEPTQADGEATPRTENEEIAKQAAQSKSADGGGGGRGGGGGGGGGAGAGNAKASKYARMNIKWADQTAGGPPLAEPYFSDKLHYSVLYS